MSEAKTVEELLAASTESMTASHKKVVADLPNCDALNEGFGMGVAYAASKFDEINDYHIVGPDCVVSPEGLEAAAEAIADSLGIAWTPENDVEQNTLRNEARVALEAAGIACANLVLTANANCGSVVVRGSTGKLGGTPLLPGDKLYVVRATVTSCDKED